MCKTITSSQGSASLCLKSAPEIRISQILKNANQSTAAFNTAIVRVNKHFQVTYLYFSYQEVKTFKLMYTVRNKTLKIAHTRYQL
jgi:hypothetical protein